MKIIVSGDRKTVARLPVIALAILLLAAGLISIAIFAEGDDSAAVNSVVESDDVSENFAVSAAVGALSNFGAESVEQAVEVWAEGVASRNGLTQYSVMSTDLGEKYLEILGDGVLLASTGATVDSWYVSEVLTDETTGATSAKLLFTISDAGESVAAMAELSLAEEGEHVTIQSLTVESPLYEFCGIGE